MSRFSCYALAVIAALTASSDSDARTHHTTTGAHASAPGTPDMSAYKQCYDMARGHWGTNSQDMQTPRDFLYRACMYDHGVHNP
jgi:hypothetical protein